MGRRLGWKGSTVLALAFWLVPPAHAGTTQFFNKTVKAPGALLPQKCAVVVAGQTVDYCYFVTNLSDQ